MRLRIGRIAGSLPNQRSPGHKPTRGKRPWHPRLYLTNNGQWPRARRLLDFTQHSVATVAPPNASKQGLGLYKFTSGMVKLYVIHRHNRDMWLTCAKAR